MRYAIRGSGKLLRPVLMLAAYRAAGGAGDASGLAAAIELVHTYSLVHDDLPCMDDDALRRGRPTVHVEFGAPVAAAAGVTMVPLAALWALEGARALGLQPAVSAAIVREIMSASGARGMVGGQFLDLDSEGKSLDPRELERIHRGKTGALMIATVRVGAYAASASPVSLAALEKYGAALGLAFQIADDVLDATGTAATLGKSAGIDAARNKSTYATLLGVTDAIALARRVTEDACTALSAEGLLTEDLECLAHFAVNRTH
jgi:geranylgeranyl pyrophosphate synthase